MLFNMILFGIWAIIAIAVETNHDLASGPNMGFAFISILFIFIAIIKVAVADSIKRQDLLEKSGGYDPWTIYSGYVNQYYAMSGLGGGWKMTSIRLPSPFDINYCKYKSIWMQSGFWQNEWNAFCLGNPSVYDGRKPLPAPWAGASDGSGCPALIHGATNQEIEMWKNSLTDNSLSL